MIDDPEMPAASADAPTSPAKASVSTADAVQFLSDASAYGGPPGSVEVKETTKSWIFLTATEVYKLKKPIRNHFQDVPSCGTARSYAMCENSSG